MTATDIENIAKRAYNYDGTNLRTANSALAWKAKRLVIFALYRAFGCPAEQICKLYGKKAAENFDKYVAKVENMIKCGECGKEYENLMQFLHDLRKSLNEEC